jgi:hypothetical protein
MHIMALHEGEVTLHNMGLSFLMCTEASIIWFNNSALVLDFTAYTKDLTYTLQRSYILWLQWPSNWTLPPNPMILKMLIEKYSKLPTKMRGVHHLAVAMAFVHCGGDHHIATLASHIWGNRGSAWMSSTCRVQPNDLAFSNTTPNVNWWAAPKMFPLILSNYISSLKIPMSL